MLLLTRSQKLCYKYEQFISVSFYLISVILTINVWMFYAVETSHAVLKLT